MRLYLIGAALAALCLTAGCSATHKGSFCAIASPLYMRQPVYDAMTDREAARMLTYLKTGERLCGWHAGN